MISTIPFAMLIGFIGYILVQTYSIPGSIIAKIGLPFKKDKNIKNDILLLGTWFILYLCVFSPSKNKTGYILIIIFIYLGLSMLYTYIKKFFFRFLIENFIDIKDYKKDFKGIKKHIVVYFLLIVFFLLSGSLYLQLLLIPFVRQTSLEKVISDIPMYTSLVAIFFGIIISITMILAVLVESVRLVKLPEVELIIDAKYLDNNFLTYIIKGHIMGDCSDGNEYYIIKPLSEEGIKLIRKDLVIDIKI